MGLQTARLALPLIAAGQAQKELSHNEALVLVDAALGAAAESAGINEPPSSPLEGQCWIVGNAPTGAWEGQGRALAIWTAGGWRFITATPGLSVWVEDRQLWAVYQGTEWVIGVVQAARLVVDGQQVVGARGLPISPPVGGGTVDAEARSAIAAIIDRLTEHGLIAS